MRSDNMPRPFAPLHDMEAKLLDIVVRLRYMASDGDHLGVNELTVDTSHLREAADEIERLRDIERENDGVIAVWRRRCTEAEDERDKLREDVAQLLGRIGDLRAKIEAAPVGEAISYSRPPMRAITGISVEGGEDVWSLVGKRVRLVSCDD